MDFVVPVLEVWHRTYELSTPALDALDRVAEGHVQLPCEEHLRRRVRDGLAREYRAALRVRQSRRIRESVDC